jgi:hypothetical protein
MFSPRLKAKLLLLLILSMLTVGAHFSSTANAECGVCSQVFNGTQGIGWGCVQGSGSSCVATSTGCTQCQSCGCNGGGLGPDEPINP